MSSYLYISVHCAILRVHTHDIYLHQHIYINNEALNRIIIRFRKRVVPHFGLIDLSLVYLNEDKILFTHVIPK